MKNLNFLSERKDLAAAFRWTARLNMHEAVANHFSLAINADGSEFLINPNQMHFSKIKASDLLVIDANDPETLEGPNAPDITAWGLHSAIHRHCPHARCAIGGASASPLCGFFRFLDAGCSRLMRISVQAHITRHTRAQETKHSSPLTDRLPLFPSQLS